MWNTPIFLATHPRSCSTAFERIFLKCPSNLVCFHEPFGEVFYFGPERISERYEPDDERKMESWCSELTFKTVLDRISETVAEGNLVFIKDMGLCLMPPYRKPATIAPSLRFRGMSHEEQYHSGCKSNGDIQKTLPHCATSVTEPLNPTVIPRNILQSFHFTFLIRHPRLSIPSLYVCSTPPMSSTTGLYGFKSEDTGYDELRRLFDYLRHVNQIGPAVAGQEEEGVEGGQEGKTNSNQVKIVVIDAEDLVNDPENIVKLYCKYVGLPFDLSMLKWDTAEERQRAEEVFGKWPGFHDVAMNSTSIKREEQNKEIKSDKDQNAEWIRAFGVDGARIIREHVDANLSDYQYLKQFALKV